MKSVRALNGRFIRHQGEKSTPRRVADVLAGKRPTSRCPMGCGAVLTGFEVHECPDSPAVVVWS